jgi:hypothetical protein
MPVFDKRTLSAATSSKPAIRHLLLLAGLSLGLSLSCTAGPQLDFGGDWIDNAAQNTRLGNLKVDSHAIAIAGVASYSVEYLGLLGSGELFKVDAVDRHPDPLGCGPRESVTYIVIVPLPAVPGTTKAAVQLILYGGSERPKPSNLEADPAVCVAHPFSRG